MLSNVECIQTFIYLQNYKTGSFGHLKLLNVEKILQKLIHLIKRI